MTSKSLNSQSREVSQIFLHSSLSSSEVIPDAPTLPYLDCLNAGIQTEDYTPKDPDRLVLDKPVEYYSDLRFMPSGPVKDLWKIKEYVFGEKSVRIRFDRVYTSALKKSPSHVVPTTMSIVAQHLSAAFFSRRFGFDFRVDERVKIWPVFFSHEIRTIITSEEDLIMEQNHTLIRKIGIEMDEDSLYFGKDKYYFESCATINETMPMTAKSFLFVI